MQFIRSRSALRGTVHSPCRLCLLGEKLRPHRSPRAFEINNDKKSAAIIIILCVCVCRRILFEVVTLLLEGNGDGAGGIMGFLLLFFGGGDDCGGVGRGGIGRGVCHSLQEMGACSQNQTMLTALALQPLPTYPTPLPPHPSPYIQTPAWCLTPTTPLQSAACCSLWLRCC